jgi:hypothetical protein
VTFGSTRHLVVLSAGLVAAMTVHLGFSSKAVSAGEAPSRTQVSPRNSRRPSPTELGTVLDGSRVERRAPAPLTEPAHPKSQEVRLEVAGEPCVVVWDGAVRRILYKKGGVCAETTFREGLMHGLDKSWYPNGQLWSRGEWRGNKREGLWQYFTKTGGLLQRGEYLDGLMSGEWVTYQGNGAVASIGSYLKQVKVGEWVYFDRFGGVHANQSGWFEDGVKVSD